MGDVNSYIWDPQRQSWIYIGGSSSAKIYYDTVEGWNAQQLLLSEKQCLYVYTDWLRTEDEFGNVTFMPGIKIGDGGSYLIDLPFIDGNVKEILEEHISNISAHVTEEDRAFWNNKCRAVDEVENENLILTIS